MSVAVLVSGRSACSTNRLRLLPSCVYLVAPQIDNDGIIRTDAGQILLAAGRKLTISSLDVAHISFEVQAPDDAVVNLGELLTAGGAASEEDAGVPRMDPSKGIVIEPES